MDRNLDPLLAAAYRSRAQVARVVTEDWVARNMYCPAAAVIIWIILPPIDRWQISCVLPVEIFSNQKPVMVYWERKSMMELMTL